MHADSGPVHIFVSHSHEDDAWCREFVHALRATGADVWYDEHNLGYGTLGDVIEAELRKRPVFIVVLSRPAVASRWVQREVDAAIRLQDQHHERVVLPVMAEKCEVPIFWGGYKRVSGLGDTALAPDEAARRVARVLNIGIEANPPTPVVTPASTPAPGVLPPVVTPPATPSAPPQPTKSAQPVPRQRAPHRLAITDVYDPNRRSILVRCPTWFLILLVGTGFLALLLVGFYGYLDPLEGGVVTTVFFTPWPLYLWFCALFLALQYSVLRERSMHAIWVLVRAFTAFSVAFVGIVYLPVDPYIGLERSFTSILSIVFWIRFPYPYPIFLYFTLFLHYPIPGLVLALINFMEGPWQYVNLGIWLVAGVICLLIVSRRDRHLTSSLNDSKSPGSQASPSRIEREGPMQALQSLAYISFPALTFLGVLSAALAAGGIQYYLHLQSDSITCRSQGHWSAALCGDSGTLTYVESSLASYQLYKSAGFAIAFGICAILAIVFSLALLLFQRRVASNTLQFVWGVFVRVFAYWWLVSLALSAVNGLASLTSLSNRAPFPQPDPIAGISFVWFVVMLIVRRVRSSRRVGRAAYDVTIGDSGI